MAPERRLFGGASPRSSGNAGERDMFHGPQSRTYIPDEQLEDGLSDLQMASRRAEAAAHRRFQAAQWLQEMLGALCMPTEPTEEEFRLLLRNGSVLCNLLNRIHPGVVPKIVENPVPSSPPDGALSAYQYFENVRNFLVAVEDMRLPSFEASDLAEGAGSLSKVVDCILALKSYYDWREGKGLSPWKYASPKAGGRSPTKGSIMVANDMEEPVVTPKSSHTRKRWAIPGADSGEAPDISLTYESGTPNSRSSPPESANGLYKGFDDAENLTSSPDSTAVRLHQIGQRFREVLQVKRLQDLQTGDLDTNPNLKGQSAQSLPSLVKSIISDKQPDEVPLLVEFMMKKVMEEFERRLRTQGEQVKKLKSLHKDLTARESKLSSRAKVLEALAAGSGEEIKLVTQQLHQTKIEKKRLEDERRTLEEHVDKLMHDRDEKQKNLEQLGRELSILKDDQKRNQEMQVQNENLIAAHVEKIVELEKNLGESLSRLEIVETNLAVERSDFKQREDKCRHIIMVQSEAIEDLRQTSYLIRSGALDMQQCWREQLMNLENELTGLTDAAQAYHNVLAENRRLYNEVQDLKGNIRVYCRVRPFLVGQEQTTCVDFVGDNGEIMIMNPTRHGKDACKMFTFNKVYGPQAAQEEVFLDAQPLIRSVLDGFNVCIFAYGQTGSGKTYTMTGPSTGSNQDWGVNYRALHDLFQLCQKRQDAFAYEVGVQMIEIYNEQVRDLLAVDGVSKRLGIRNSSSINGVHVPDAVMIPVASSADVLEIMAVGQKNRAVGATALNERSSRSHSVLTVHVQGTDLVKGYVLRGCLHLVDLAGSERVEKSEATGERLKEAQHINKSLSALGDVIAALAQKSSHIPYRNSKLTQLLQHSLGGQAKALMFVHINPDTDSYGETISTLKFAERVSSVELGAARTNREAGEVREFKEQIVALKEMLAKKESEIERLHATRGHEKQKLRLHPNRLSQDSRVRKEGSVSSRASSRDPSPDQAAYIEVGRQGTIGEARESESCSMDKINNFPETPRSFDWEEYESREHSAHVGNMMVIEHASEEASQDVLKEQSCVRSNSSGSDLRSSMVMQTRPPKSERKPPSLAPATASASFRRLSDVAAVDFASSVKSAGNVRQSGLLFQNAGSKSLSKRWL